MTGRLATPTRRVRRDQSLSRYDVCEIDRAGYRFRKSAFQRVTDPEQVLLACDILAGMAISQERCGAGHWLVAPRAHSVDISANNEGSWLPLRMFRSADGRECPFVAFI